MCRIIIKGIRDYAQAKNARNNTNAFTLYSASLCKTSVLNAENTQCGFLFNSGIQRDVNSLNEVPLPMSEQRG